MKKTLAGIAILAFLLTGCASKAGTGSEAAATSVASSIDSEVAMVGTTVNIPNNGIIGYALDEQDRKIIEKTSPRTVERMDRNEPLTTTDIIRLSQGGVNDETILKYIHETNTTYNLSTNQVRRLQQGGVSQRIINYMVDTGR